MKILPSPVLKKRLLLCCTVFAIATSTTFGQRIVQSFDNDWQFHKGDTAGAEQTSFNAGSWRKLNVPHDYSIEGNYDRANPTGRGGGYLPNGVGWYRKQFNVPASYSNRKVRLELDGVMANSEVYLNGKLLGKRPFGYVQLVYDLTPFISFGKANVIAVKTDNSLQPASRWYSGGGIYRHTRLVITDPVSIDPGGVFMSTPQVTDKSAMTAIQVAVTNTAKSVQKVVIQTMLFDAAGKQVATSKTNETIAPEKSISVKQQVAVSNPVLWSIENPTLYRAVTKLLVGDKVLDDVTTLFGFRTIRFDAATGFYLNNKNIKLKGVCLHHDGGAVGAAVPLRIWEKRLETLKELGANAIRTAHNPMAPEFLDLCDRMGMLVMNETFDTWTAKKSNADNGYNLYFNEWWQRDTRDIVVRDRNHPSLIMYSVGNEIRDNLKDSAGFKRYTDQQNLVHELDPTRPVTMAIFRPGDAGVYQNGFIELMDVVGQNYREPELVAVHEKKPGLKVIGTENGHTRDAWLTLRDKPYMAGQFLWTGVDYLGEADWPRISNEAGLIDRTGRTRPRSFERQSWWSEKPMVHVVRSSGNGGTGMLVSDWSPVDVDTYDEANVQVFSNCDEVELFLNDKSLGSKPRPADDAPRTWQVTFAKGNLKAVGKNKGVVAATHEIKTAGEPARLLLTVDKQIVGNDFDDVVFVRATVVDVNGIVCPHAEQLVTFKLTGAGVITAVDNGNTASHESYRGNKRQAYMGEAVAIISANADTGTINITADAEGLQQGSVTIKASTSGK